VISEGGVSANVVVVEGLVVVVTLVVVAVEATVRDVVVEPDVTVAPATSVVVMGPFPPVNTVAARKTRAATTKTPAPTIPASR
jgi:hypothetical protein